MGSSQEKKTKTQIRSVNNNLATKIWAKGVRDRDSVIHGLIDKAPTATFIFQGAKNRLVNAAAETLTGYSRKELLAMDFWEIIHPDYREMIKQRGFARQRGVKIPPRYELKIIRKNGEERWLDYSGALIKFRGKMATIGTAIDITERKLAQERERSKLSQIRALHEMNLAAISTLDLDRVLEILLEKVDQFLPCPAVSIIRVINPEAGTLEAKAFRNISEVEWERLIPKESQGLSLEVIERRSPVVLADALKDPRTRFPEFFREHGLVSYAGVPLIYNELVLGHISVFTKQKYEFSEEEIRFLTSLASQATVAIQNSRLYRQMKRKTEQLSSLNALTTSTTQSLDLKLELQEAIKGVTKLFGFDGVCIYLFDEVMTEAHLKASLEVAPESWSRIQEVASKEGFVGKVATSGEMVIIDDVQTDPRYEQLIHNGDAKTAGVRFLATFPIQTKVKSWGALSCMDKNPRRLSVEEIDWLIAICSQIGIAIENATLYQRTTEKAKELAALYSVAGMSAQVWDINALLHQSTRKILEIFGFTAARIYILDTDENEIRLVTQEGFREGVVPPRNYRIGEGLVGKVIKTGEPLTFQDMQNDPEYHRLAKKKTMLEAGFRGSFFIPLTVRGETLGVMNLVSREPHAFSRNDIHLINSIAYHLGIAIENATLLSQLRKRTADLEKAGKAKDEFLSIMSHELRTPLNIIMGYTDLMHEGTFGNLNPDLESAVTKVSRQAKELLSMIESVWDTTRLEAGLLELKPKEIDLCEFFEQLKPTCNQPLENDLRLIWNIPRNLPPVKTDDETLKHILQNLIGNALKFTAKGSVTVSARYLLQEQKIEVKVRDTGIGIPPESIPEIFEMFRQGDSSETRPYGGVGLGLYIVKKLTDLLDGAIEVESELGKGSTFTVTVPVKT